MGKWIFHIILSLALGACSSSDPQVHGQPVAVLTVGGASVYNFSSQRVGTVSIREFTVTNGGRLPATSLGANFYVSAFGFTGGAFPGNQGTCRAELAVDRSCTVEIQFAPGYLSNFQDTIQIKYFNGVSNVSTEYPSLMGSGI